MKHAVILEESIAFRFSFANKTKPAVFDEEYAWFHPFIFITYVLQIANFPTEPAFSQGAPEGDPRGAPAKTKVPQIQRFPPGPPKQGPFLPPKSFKSQTFQHVPACLMCFQTNGNKQCVFPEEYSMCHVFVKTGK